MFCPYCGAELAEDAPQCAYCGHENEQIAHKRQKQEVAGIYARLAARLHMPRRAVGKATRFLLIGAGALAGLFLLALLFSLLWARIGPQIAYDRQQAQLARLEELYQAGEYAALEPAMERMRDARGAAYDKYKTVSDLCQSLLRARESCTEAAGLLRDYPEGAELLAYDLETLFGLLCRCDALKEAGYVYGEREAAEAIGAQAEELLKETLLLTPQEIEQGKALAGQEEPDYSALCAASARRIAGGGA